MSYSEILPKLGELKELSAQVKNFPISGLGVLQLAEHTGYPGQTLDFLKLFSARLVFKSRTDFMNRCSLLERMVREEQRQPVEALLEED